MFNVVYVLIFLRVETKENMSSVLLVDEVSARPPSPRLSRLFPSTRPERVSVSSEVSKLLAPEISPPEDAPSVVQKDKFPSLAAVKGGETKKEKRWEKITKKPSAWERLKGQKWIIYVVLFLISLILLYVLQPPLVCKTNARDDLDAYQCSAPRLLVWSCVAPLIYFLMPFFGF